MRARQLGWWAPNLAGAGVLVALAVWAFLTGADLLGVVLLAWSTYVVGERWMHLVMYRWGWYRAYDVGLRDASIPLITRRRCAQPWEPDVRP